MALRGGVDLVIELPFPFACSSAPRFALGAVQVLAALGGVDSLCFGSESGDLGPLQGCADLLLEHEGEITARTAARLRRGISFPDARAAVVAELAGPAEAAALSTPNNILGIAYLKALRQTGSRLAPHAIPRVGAGYHDLEAVGAIASATGIRRMLASGRDVAAYLPTAARPPLREALRDGRFLDPELLHRLVLARLLRGPESLAGIYLIDDGLESRLFAAAVESASWDALAGKIKGRHLTLTRIQRILMYALHDLRREAMEEYLAAGPLYLRVLGCAGHGEALLAAGRQERSLPLLHNMSRARAVLKKFYGDTERGRLALRMLGTDLHATRLYTLLMKGWTGGNRNRDYFADLIRVQP
jgi:predicted nucleotidyltransferase